MKKFAIALAAITVAAPAVAQEADFSGPYVAAIVGYDIIDAGGGIENPEGVAYGVNFGYDYQAGSAVFGIEAEVAESTANIEVADIEVAAAGRDLYIGGRVGYVVGSRSLVYVKAGYTNARAESFGIGENVDGFRIGGGAETKFSTNLFGKVEYRYSNYEADVSRHQVVAGVGFRF